MDSEAVQMRADVLAEQCLFEAVASFDVAGFLAELGEHEGLSEVEWRELVAKTEERLDWAEVASAESVEAWYGGDVSTGL